MTNADSTQPTATLTINQAFQQAIAHHQAGQLQDAERLYRGILQAQPSHPGANHNLGVLALQVKQPAIGLPYFKVALEANPSHGQYWLSYADALLASGQVSEALNVIQKAIQNGHDTVAIQAMRQKTEAVALSLSAKGAAPASFKLQSLADLFNAGHHAELEKQARLLLEQYPDSGLAWKMLGASLQMQGKDALTTLQKAAQLSPDDAEAIYNLGTELKSLGQLEGAVASYRRALEINPNIVEAHNNLGNALKDIGQLDCAVASYRRALEINPNFAEAHNNLGNALRDLGQLDAAVASYHRMLAIRPGYAVAHYNVGVALQDSGQIDGSVTSFRRALEIRHDFAEAYSNMLFVLNYHPDKSDEEIFAAYREYDARFGLPHHGEWREHGNNRETNRRLKVGYVSPDFKQHSVRHFLEPLLSRHDKRVVEVYAYAEIEQEDAVTARYKSCVDHWISTIGLSDAVLTERIRADGIDILVDLAGHTRNNRLGVFARKPAPVSVSWLGFGYTTGLSAVDYFLTDGTIAPMGSEGLFSEMPWRLETPNYVYRPAEGMGEVSPLPAAERGYVTFGTLTRAVRINHRTVRVWSEILKRVEGARLVLDSKNYRDVSMQTTLEAQFAVHGINRERLEIGYHSPPWDVLRGLDIGLDCFPHNSGTTLFETLYMGVPFVTLAGRPSVGRMGSAILEGVGHPEWIARTEEEYVEKAVALAMDLTRLAALRAGLRKEMETGRLMDEAGFARRVEVAYREMFAKWAGREVLIPGVGGDKAEKPAPKDRAAKLSKVAKYAKQSQKMKGRPGAGPSAYEMNAFPILFAQGCYQEMENLARSLTQRFPRHGVGWKALGTALQRQGRRAEALMPLKQAALLLPEDAESHFNLGVCLKDQGLFNEAENSYRRTLQLKPDFAAAHCNLGNIRMEQSRFTEAEGMYRRAITLKPDYAEAYLNLGNAFMQQGRLTDAEESYRKALVIKPDSLDLHVNLGVILQEQGRLTEAEALYHRALEIKPYSAEAHNNLGNTLQKLGRLSDSEVSYRRALEAMPDYADAHNNLGNTLKELGRINEAEVCYRRALEIKPDYEDAFGNLLFTLNYHPDRSGEEIFAAYREYDDRFCLPHHKTWRVHQNQRDGTRRLKVGYVSPDFRKHSVRHFLEPLLSHHDKRVVEVYAYAEVAQEDAVTARYKSYVDHWICTIGLSDEALAKRIRADGIDILVDLAGHTAKNRLGVFARKPAPVSLSWLGYGYTTGLTAIDYLLTDATSTPEGSEGLFSETLWRLATSGYVYRPADDMGEVSSLPAATRGYVTFGTLTRAVRINHRTIRVWAEILKRVNGARLVVDSKNFQDAAMQAELAEKFAAHGIGRERLVLGYHSPPWDVLRGLDIGLDCFPHNSGTTLFETLYMGVPFVTLAGRPSVGRLGSAILKGVVHPEWIAQSEHEYIEKAVTLAADLPKLAELRSGLRQEMENSPLMDERGFACKVESAYREMFSKWART